MRADAAAEHMPARWIDVSAPLPVIHAAVGAAMQRHRYTPHESYAEIAAWTTPIENGHRLFVSLLVGLSHANRLPG